MNHKFQQFFFHFLYWKMVCFHISSWYRILLKFSNTSPIIYFLNHLLSPISKYFITSHFKTYSSLNKSSNTITFVNAPLYSLCVNPNVVISVLSFSFQPYTPPPKVSVNVHFLHFTAALCIVYTKLKRRSTIFYYVSPPLFLLY